MSTEPAQLFTPEEKAVLDLYWTLGPDKFLQAFAALSRRNEVFTHAGGVTVMVVT